MARENRLRLALLTPYAEPVKGGISSYVAELQRAYAAIGLDAKGFALQGATNPEFEVLGPSRVKFSARSLLLMLRWRPDIVHAHANLWILLAGILVKMVRPRTKLLFTLHTEPGVRKKTTKSFLIRAFSRNCDGVVFVSRSLMQTFALPSSVRQTVIYPAPEHWAISRPDRVNRTQFRSVVFVGPLVWPLKAAGVAMLLEAFSKIASKYSGWRLRIFGDGPLRKQLEAKAKELGIAAAVDFMGAVQSGLEALSQASIYAQVSLQEGVPLSVLNAMAMGLPVLATSVGGMPEVLRDTDTGIVVNPTVGDVTTALDALIGNPELQSRIGAQGREWVRTTLSWENVAREGLEFVGVRPR